MSAFACFAALNLGLSCQHPDWNYQPVIPPEAMTYPDSTEDPPVIAVDTTHANHQTIDNRFLGFRRLLQADGYTVTSFDEPYSDGCLADLEACDYWQALSRVDVLVIANPLIAIPAGEAELIAQWVAGGDDDCGGRLMLIADHSPYPVAVTELADRLGIDWRQANVFDSLFLNPLLATAGTLGFDHPVTTGMVEGESILVVATFRGSAFGYVGPEKAESILTFPPGRVWFDPTGLSHPADGLSQGMTIEFGQGRVYASADAAMFTAQVGALGPFGMQATLQNQQYLLNVMHWLDGLAEPILSCSLAQRCPCEGPAGSGGPWKDRGAYVSCVAQLSEAFVIEEGLSEAEKGGIVRDAAQSGCGASQDH